MRKGFKYSEEHKKNIGLVSIGRNESQIINEIEKQLNCTFIRQYRVLGYFLDGYYPEKNLAIELDEMYHFIEGELREQDKIREMEITKHLKCNFIRIQDSGGVANAY